MLQSGNVGIAPSPHWKRRAQQPPSPTKGKQPKTARSVTLGQRAVLTMSVACLALGLTCLLVTIYVKQQRLASSLQQLVATQSNWTAAVVESSVQSRRLVDATSRLVQLLHNRKSAARWRKERRKWRNRGTTALPGGSPGSVRPSKKHRKKNRKGGKKIPRPGSSGGPKHRKESEQRSDKRKGPHDNACTQQGEGCRVNAVKPATTTPEPISSTVRGQSGNVESENISVDTGPASVIPTKQGDNEAKEVSEKRNSSSKSPQLRLEKESSEEDGKKGTITTLPTFNESSHNMQPSKNNTDGENATSTMPDVNVGAIEVTTVEIPIVSTARIKQKKRRKLRRQRQGKDM